MRSELADLMGHKESTATRFYRLQEKQGTCLEAGSNLPVIMRAPEKTPASASSTSAHSGNLKEKNLRFFRKEEEVVALKELFADEIENTCVTMEVVRNKITLSSRK